MIETPNIFFDLDDTLHDWQGSYRAATKAVWEMLASETGLPRDVIEKRYLAKQVEQSSKDSAEGFSSRIYRSARCLAAIEGAFLPTEPRLDLTYRAVELYNQELLANSKLKPLARQTLDKLKGQGARLALVTNGPEDAQNNLIRHLDIAGLFERVFTSGGYRLSKKNGLFLLAARETGWPAQQITVVGDSIENDVEPAAAAGMKPIWFNDGERPNPKGLRQITRLDQLVA